MFGGALRCEGRIKGGGGVKKGEKKGVKKGEKMMEFKKH